MVEWGLDGFDLVVGNPPYQSSTKDDNGANSLWVKFIEKSNRIINNDSYILFITGDSWLGNEENYTESGRMTITKIRSRIFKNNHLCFVKYGKKLNNFFNVSIDFCYFLMRKTNIIKKTKIVNDYGEYEEYYKNMLFIPKYNIELCLSIMNKTLSNTKLEKISILDKDRTFISDTRKWNGNFSKEKTKEHIYPTCNTSAQYTKDIFIWSNKKDINQDTKKVIFSDSGYLSPIYDNGKFGLNSHSYAIVVNDESESINLINYMNSKIVIFLSKCFPSSGFENTIVKVIINMPQIDLSRSWIDQELYEYFNLTPEEIQLIEETIEEPKKKSKKK
jgi:hypothetical protein